MKSQNAKIFIYPKDVSMITGKSMRSTYKLLIRMRNFFHKEPHHLITVSEFCQYMGVKSDDVLNALMQ